MRSRSKHAELRTETEICIAYELDGLAGIGEWQQDTMPNRMILGAAVAELNLRHGCGTHWIERRNAPRAAAGDEADSD